MSKRVAIVQSCYIPWKGYFDMIRSVDEFVLYDDMQYTRRDWRNRNRVKTADGVGWLTIPVEVKGKYLQAIKDTRVSDPGWSRSHWRTLVHQYGRAPFFRPLAPAVEDLYRRAAGLHFLSEINHLFLSGLCGLLGIGTRLSWSMDYRLEGDRTERLVGVCRQAGATEYLSGPAAKAYMDEASFARAGVALTYMDYSGYPEYPQLHGPFDHYVSVLDLLFMAGPSALSFLNRVPHAA